jgi:putative protease
MRSIFYVGAVVRVYRAALDYLATLPAEAWDDPGRIKIPQHYSDELAKTGTRAASTHFIDGTADESAMLNDCSRHPQSYEPVAVIKALSSPQVLVEVRNAASIRRNNRIHGTRFTNDPVLCYRHTRCNR